MGLLGSGAGKIGSVTACPKCGADLVVPMPPASGGVGTAAFASSSSSGISESPEQFPDEITSSIFDRIDLKVDEIRAEAMSWSGRGADAESAGLAVSASLRESGPARVGGAPAEGLAGETTGRESADLDVEVIELEPAIVPSSPAVERGVLSQEDVAWTAEPVPPEDLAGAGVSGAPAGAKPVDASERVQSGPTRPAPAAPTVITPTVVVRARDIVIPRVVLFAWSLLVILATGMAFTAGLLAGHFLWTIR